MAFELLDDEWTLFENVPLDDLVEFAADLDLVIPGTVDRKSLVVQCLPGLLVRARDQGVPISKYDAEDLNSLATEERDTLAQLLGLPAGSSVAAIIKAGEKVSKAMQRASGHTPYAYMMPLFLRPLLRFARSGVA